MKTFIHFLAISLAVTVQLSALAHLKIYGATVNLVLLVGLSLILTKRIKEGWWYLAGGSLALEVLSPAHPYGIYFLSNIIVGALLTYIIIRVFSEPSYLLATGLFALSVLLSSVPLAIYSHQWFLLIPTTIYNMAAGVAAYFLTRSVLAPKAEIKI